MTCVVEVLASLPASERDAWLASLTPAEAELFLNTWAYWARPNQLTPAGDWTIWLFMGGRGTGKTRTGAEQCKDWVENDGVRRIALVGATAADVRDTMVEGESGILNLYWRDQWRPIYEPSKARVRWPNGAIAKMYSAEKPSRLRGPQHEKAWVDEPAAWRYREAWDQLMFGLRLGAQPQCIATTTPKPVELILELARRTKPQGDEPADVVLTAGSTYENRANLAPQFLRTILRRYEGTRLGQQEIMGALLTDTPGALWTTTLIDSARRRSMSDNVPTLVRVVVGVDPGGSSGPEAEERGAETGIVTAGIGRDGHFYVLGDTSGTMTPGKWGQRVADTYAEYSADRIAVERNFGGDMVESTIRTVNARLPVKTVNASRGKAIRAEPVSALYEQGKVHHIGFLGTLESEMTTWVPGVSTRSPNRLDALVWAITELMDARPPSRGRAIGIDAASPYEQ